MSSETAVTLASRLEHWPLDRLVPYARNARTHSDAQIDKLAASMIEFGFTAPILVDEGSGILAGHGRLEAARKIGLASVPVIELTHLTPAQKRAYIIADNRLAEDAGWNQELLAEEIRALAADGFNVELTGFESAELDDFLKTAAGAEGSGAPDAAPPVSPGRCVAQLGDVWQLGDHRLLCGDATSVEALQVVMDGAAADAVWTDPPYNVDYTGGTAEALKIENDAQAPADFDAFLRAAFTGICSVLKPGGVIYVAHADTKGLEFRRAFVESGFHLASCLIWRKNALVLGHADYHWQHEPILYGWRDDGAHEWLGARDKSTDVALIEAGFQQTGDNEWQLAQGETTLIVRGENLTIHRAHGSVFFEEKPSASVQHPTMKPVALIERMLINSCRRGAVVLDPFAGSGSTAIACQRLGRRARLVEIDPRYCDVIVRRWQDFTGRAALLPRTAETFTQREEALK